MSDNSLRVAIVGGGVAGYTAAILLARGGASVTLLDARRTFDAGSGIMLQSHALRGLRDAGVLDAVKDAGYPFDSTGVRIPDSTSRLVAELTEGRIEPDLPAAVGIARSRLADCCTSAPCTSPFRPASGARSSPCHSTVRSIIGRTVTSLPVVQSRW